MYPQEKVDVFYPEAHIYEAMEIWTLPKNKKAKLEKVCDEEGYFAQLKIDGNWYEFNKSPLGKSYLFSRGVSVKTGLPTEGIQKVPHIEKAMENIPNDTVLIGEIYVDNGTTNEVRSIMGCLPKKAIERQKKNGFVKFYLHDIVRFQGRDITSLGAYDRYKILTDVYETFIPNNSPIELAPIILNDIYSYIGKCLADNQEGVVLKKKDAPYSEGKRPAWATIKVKKEDTADLVCIGFEEATMEYTGTELETWEYWAILKQEKENWVVQKRIHGKPEYIRSPEFKTIPITKPFYNNWKTSLILGAYKNNTLIKVGTVSSGLTDELREEISSNQEKYLNKVVECKCMEITKDSLRHPIFIRFRDDKNSESCTFESIFS